MTSSNSNDGTTTTTTITNTTTAATPIRIFMWRALAFGALVFCVRKQFADESSTVLLTSDKVKKRNNSMASTSSMPLRLRNAQPGTSILGLDSLPDLTNTSLPRASTEPTEYWQESIRSRKQVIDIVERAGLNIDLELLNRLPKWSDVTSLYGPKPVIVGMDRCAAFREAHRPSARWVAIAGQFNTGTNAMAKYFFSNLIVAGNKEPGMGFIANVPWHKHGWVDLREQFYFQGPSDHTAVLPVVIVRDPYFWFQSMCESPYLMKWKHGAEHCPNLVDETQTSVPVQLILGNRMQHKRVWDSLVHVWSEFYGEYFDAEFPRLIVRFEDLLFHTHDVIDSIRKCAGGSWRHDDFQYQTESSKGGKKYFEEIKPQSSMVSAIIKYGQDFGQRVRNMTDADLRFARKYLDHRLMEAFHYIHPDEL